MAKKVRKRTIPLWLLFFELLIPWVAMGLVAIVCSYFGLEDYAIFVVSLAAALATTFAVRQYERRRRRRSATTTGPSEPESEKHEEKNT